MSGRAGAEKPYAPGHEYVAFLRWDSATDRFLRINGPIYMFPIRDGRVEFRRTDTPGIFDGMPIEEFTRALRAVMSATTRVAELHWYEAHGIGKKEFKRKRYLDQGT